LKKFVLAVTFVFILFSIMIFLKFGSALTQEGNPTPILTSILKLELSNNGYQIVSENDRAEKYVSEFKLKYPYGIVKEIMKDDGWTFQEQMGSGLIFVKNDETIVVETRQFTKSYYLWTVPK
jgi:hypothetical protein